MANTTPGLWFNYFSGPILGSAAVTVALIPGNYNLYVRYFTIATPNTIPTGTLIYLAYDGIPILSLNNLRQSAEVSLVTPIVVTSAISMGVLTGGSGFPFNMLVSYYGDMVG